jgi:hypothetical protein
LLENTESALVTVEDPITHTTPMLEAPIEPLLVRLDSFGNIIEEEVPRFPSRPITETYMGSKELIFNDEFRTPICHTDTTDPHQTPARSIWRTPSGRDIYEHFDFIRQPLDPNDPLSVEAEPSGQTIDRPIEHVVNPVATSAKIHLNDGIVTPNHTKGTSTVTPTVTPLHTTTPHVPQDLVGTPLQQKMQTIFRHTQSTTRHIPTGGKPPSSGPILPGGKPSFIGPTLPRGQPPLHVPFGGQPPFTGQTTVVNQPMVKGKPSFVRNPSQS